MANFILASSSKSRINLLKKINFIPELIIPADIDETPYKKEKPEIYVQRMAKEKCEKIADLYPNKNILAADAIVVTNRQIIQKAKNKEDIIKYLSMFSGKNIKSLTALYFKKENGEIIKKIIETKIKFKNLNQQDIKDIVNTEQGIGCAGGISMEGYTESLVKSINGSYSNILGLPLYETRNILISANIK